MKVQPGVEDVSLGELRVGVCKVGLSCLTFGQHSAHTTGSPLLLSSVMNRLMSSGSLRKSETLRSPHLQQFLLVSDFNGGTRSCWSSILADLRDAYVCLSWHGYGHWFTQGGEVLHILLPLRERDTAKCEAGVELCGDCWIFAKSNTHMHPLDPQELKTRSL